MLLYEQQPCPHGTVSLQHPDREMGRRGKEEAADYENLPELFPDPSFALCFGSMDFEMNFTPTEVSEVQTLHLLISPEEG